MELDISLLSAFEVDLCDAHLAGMRHENFTSSTHYEMLVVPVRPGKRILVDDVPSLSQVQDKIGLWLCGKHLFFGGFGAEQHEGCIFSNVHLLNMDIPGHVQAYFLA
jgi:hypothetical protein